MSVWSLAIDWRTNDFYIGNDIGVYKLTGGVGNWARVGIGMPNVQVKDIEISLDLNILSAGTYGRSMYQFYLNDMQMNSGALRAVAGSNVWTGPIRLAGDTTVTVNGSQVLQSGLAAAQLNVVGVISDANYQANYQLTKAGQGDLTLSAANTYGGLTELQGGVIVVQNSQALGAFRPGGADITAQGGTIVNAGTALVLRSSLALEGVELNGDGVSQSNQHNTGALRNASNNNTFTGILTFNTDTTIGTDAGTSLTIGTSDFLPGVGTIGGNFGFDKELTGTLILNSANTYTGLTTVNQGILHVQNSAALGAADGTAATGTVVLDAAQLQISSPVTGVNTGIPVLVGDERLSISGTGVNNTGAILNGGGDNTWGGRVTFDYLPSFSPITVPTNYVLINVTAGSSLKLDGGIAENTSRPGSPIAFGLTKTGGGTLYLTKASTYSEQTNVLQGVLSISDSNALGTFGPGVSTGSPLIHNYQFTGLTPAAALADALGGPALQELVANSGTLTGTRYNFLDNQGLFLNNALPNPGNYSIEMLFHFNTLSGWTRILDMKDRTDDDGWYQITGSPGTGALQFYNLPVAPVANNIFTAGVDIHLTFTRNAVSNQVNAYVNGVLANSFIDAGNDAVFTGLNGIIHFFTDDLVISDEASPGSVDFIRIYNTPLNAAQALAAFTTGTVTSGIVSQTNTIVQAGAALELAGGIDVPAEGLIVSGDGINGTGAIRNIAGVNSFAGDVTLQANTTIGADAGTQLTLSGVLHDPSPAPFSAPSVTKVGTGTVVLTAANTFRGQTSINAGVLNIQNSSALGINANEVQQVTVSGTSGSYTLNFNGQISSPLLPGASALQMQNALNNLSTINSGGGSVSVTQVNNVYTVFFDGGPLAGGNHIPLIAVAINGTVVNIANSQDGGTGSGTTVASGATLQLQNDINLTVEALVINGAGFNNAGALQNVSGTNTWNGPLALVGNSSIGATGTAAGDKLVLNTSITQSGGSFNVTKVGPGTAQFSGSTANAYTGVTHVLDGTLELNKSVTNGAILGNLIVGDTTPVNEVQTLTIPATVTSFRLTFNGNATNPIAYTGVASVDRAAISAALNRISILGFGGSVVVASTAANVFTITFGGNLAGEDQLPITATTLAGTGTITTSPTIDGTPFSANSDIVKLLQPAQIADASTVIVNPDGFLNLDGFAEQFGALTINDGHVQVNNVGGAGSLTIPSFTMTGGLVDNAGAGSTLYLTGSLTATSSANSTATITGAGGTLDLTGSTGSIAVGNGPRSSDLVVGNSIVGVAEITKTQAGRLEISSGGAITMLTIVDNGDLQIDAGATAANIELDGAGSSVSGAGSIGTITGAQSPTDPADGMVNPGSNGGSVVTGILSSQSVVWGSTTTFFVNLDNPGSPLTQPVAGTEYDQLAVTGNADLGGATLHGLVGANVQIGDSFTILTTTGQITGQLSGLRGATTGLIPQDGVVFVGGVKFRLHYDYAATNGSVVLTRALMDAGTVLTANPGATTLFGQPVNYTVTITPEVGAGLPASTTVTFSIDGGVHTTIVPVVVNGSGVGTATLDPQSFFGILPLASGYWAANTTHTIDATLNAFGFSSSPAPTFTQTINKASANVALTANPTVSTYGQPVVLSAVVTAVSPGSGGPSNGVVNFYRNSVSLANLLGAGVLSGNTYTLTTGGTQLPVGTHSFIAVFAGDTNLIDRTTTLSNFVVGKATTAISATTAGSLVYGAPMTLTVVVSATSAGLPGSPLGTVAVTSTGVTFGTPVITQPTASTTAYIYTFNAPSAGTHDLNITFTGTPAATTNFANSSSNTSSFVIAKADTAVALSSSAPIGAAGASITLTATVTTQAPSVGAVNNGTVTFTNSTTGQVLGTSPVALVAGVGKASLNSALNTPAFQLGDNSIIATYNPPASSANFTGSASSTLTQTVRRAVTLTSTASPSPSLFGQTVNVTLNVAGTGVAPPTPTGTVSVFDGATLVGTGMPGAVIPVTGLSLGTHTLTITYDGDTNYAPSGVTRTQVVAQAPTTTIVTSNMPVQYGQASTFEAKVSASFGGTPTLAVVTFFDNGVAMGSGTLLSSDATSMTYSFTPLVPLTVGSHAITARYTGSANFLASTSTAATHVVSATTTTTTLSATAPTKFGQNATFSVHVDAASGITPSGKVTFFDGTTVLGTAPLNLSGDASLTISTLSTSSHSISAVYIAATNFATSTSNAITHVVNQADTGTTVSSNAAAGAVYGQVVTFSITVAATSGGPTPGIPTGTVSLFDGVLLVASGLPLVNGVATYVTTSPLAVATHAFSATYFATTNYAASTSAAFNQDITAASTTTTLSSVPTFWALNEPVTFAAMVTANTPSTATPTGMVTFIVDGVAQAPVPLDTNGRATTILTFTSTANPNNHTVSVQFVNDNANFQASTAPTQTQNVRRRTDLALGALLQDPGETVALEGEPILFYAIIAGAGGGIPTGVVEYFDNGVLIGTGTLNASGIATLTLSGLSIGTHSITAHYVGDPLFNEALSVAPLSQVIVRTRIKGRLIF